jgi:hypothetical protein
MSLRYAGIGLLAVGIVAGCRSPRADLVGRWHCELYYGSRANLTFLSGGSYAIFQESSVSRTSEFGTWDVVDGTLVTIIDHGSSVKDSVTWARVNVSSDTLLIKAADVDEVRGQCSRVKGAAGF